MRTDELFAKMEKLSKYSSEDASIVVVGSIGRREVTESSDVDWTLLIDGPSDPSHAQAVTDIRADLESLDLEKPGRTETFGVMAFSHELVHYIAGAHDTNENLTRRILLLIESRAVTQPLVRERVIRNILERYIAHDIVVPRSIPPSHALPHFLMNDVVRYWRTVASDYAAKMWERNREGWGLRNIKLRFSRKLIFVAGLLACYSFEIDPPDDAATIRGDRDRLTTTLTTSVARRLEMTPLESLASVLAHYGDDDLARKIFGAYDRFLGILLDPGKRMELKELRIEGALHSKVWEEAHNASHDFRNGLEELFLKTDGVLRELTIRFGVF
ncbi:MAG: nucleotidyltransferase domain-containing protein [Acidobacteriota bacterium]